MNFSELSEIIVASSTSESYNNENKMGVKVIEFYFHKVNKVKILRLISVTKVS
jgi:hypothetical protein